MPGCDYRKFYSSSAKSLNCVKVSSFFSVLSDIKEVDLILVIIQNQVID